MLKLELNRRDVFENTPLMEAIKGNHVECVRSLVRFGVDTSIRNSQNYTALMVASRNGHTAIQR